MEACEMKGREDIRKVNKGNSFYDVFEEERTEEQLHKYKRLIGMPLAEDYEELMDFLK